MPFDVTVKTIVPEGPPPGPGLATLTLSEPCVAISAAGIGAVSCVALINVVVRGDPFQLTCVPRTKFVPVTVSVNAGPPTTALDGDNCVMAGSGLFAAPMVNRRKLERLLPALLPVVGPGDVTPTDALPALARFAVIRAAVNCVALTKVVVSPAPLNVTVEPETNPAPVTVSVQ